MEKYLLRSLQLMNKVKSLFKKIFANYESILLFLSILLVNFDLVFSIVKLSSLASLCFRSTYVIIGAWIIVKLVLKIKQKKIFKNVLKDSFIRQLLLVLIVSIITFIPIIIPFFTTAIKSFDYFTKYICLVFTMLYIVLLTNGEFSRKIPRLSIFVSVLVGLMFCAASFIGSLRGQTYTGAYSFNFSNPNATALAIGYTVACLAYGVFITHSKILKVFVSLETMYLLFLLYKTQARAPIIGLFVALVFVLIIKLFKKKNSLVISSFIVSFILFSACVYVIILVSISGASAPQVLNLPAIGKGISSRYSIWTEAFKRIATQPLLGFYGTFNGQLQYHNAILDLFVAYGAPVAIILTLCFIVLLTKAFGKMKFIVNSQYVALFSLCSFFFTGLFESCIFSSAQGLYILCFSFILGIRLPLTDDCISENNAIYFNEQTSKNCNIILINSVYKKGSTGKIVDTLKNGIEKAKFEAFVLYGRKEIDTPVHNASICTSKIESVLCRLLNKITKDGSLFNYFSTFEYIRIIKKYKPQVVHVHCLNDHYINQYILFRFLKKHHIKTVLTLHSENLYVGCQEGHVFDCENWCSGNKCLNCNKYKSQIKNERTWKRLNRMFLNFEELQITAVSPWLAERAKKSTICKDIPIKTVLNGLDDAFNFSLEKSNMLPDNLNDKKKILFVCANASNPHKGFKYFEQLASEFESDSNIQFICLSLEQYSNNFHSNVTFLNPIKDIGLLAKIYSECDVSLVLSKKETFSMPTAESLCCGTKVAGFECGGAESIASGENAIFVEQGNVDLLKKAINQILSENYDKQKVSAFSREIYLSDNMINKFLKIYNLNDNSKAYSIEI